MEALLVRYGYLLLFLGVAAEGEAFLLAAAYLAHRGVFHLATVVGVAVAANTVADQVYYLAARRHGRAWLERRFGDHPRLKRVEEEIARRGRLLLLISRYAFGFRILIPAACGAAGMPVATFTPVNILAGVIWAVPTALLGYYAGGAVESVLRELRHYEVAMALAAVLVPATVFGLRRLSRRVRLRDLTWSDLHGLVPLLMGLMGAFNLLSAIVPRTPASLAALEQWLPLEVVERSRAVMLFAGIALLQVTRNLARRKELAWWAATLALTVSLFSHVGRGLDLHHSLVAGLLLAYLLVFRRRFNARSDPASLKTAFLLVPVLAAAVLAYAAVGLSDLRAQYAWEEGATPAWEAVRVGLLTLEPALEPRTALAARFLGSVQIAAWLSRLYLLVLVLRPVVLRRRAEADPGDVSRIFAQSGRRSLAAFAVQEDKHHLLVAGGRGLVAYAVRGPVALSCAEPLAPADALAAAIADFVEHCRAHGWTPCLYEASDEALPACRALGLHALKIAEEPIVDLPSFSLAGGKRAALRAQVHKVEKAGLGVEAYRRGETPDPDTDVQLEVISEEWLAEKRLAELGFTMGRFSLEALDDVHAFVCRSATRVEAFCSFLPYRNGEAAVLDLMRKRADAISGTMDVLIAKALLELKAAGLKEASLANAPLANVGEPHSPLERGVALLFENLNAVYGYKNLFQFKKKFAPRWEGRYLVYPGGADLPTIGLALTNLHGGGGLRRLLLGR